MSLALEFCSAFILVFCEVVSWYRIVKKRIEFKNIKLYLVVLCIVIFQIFNYHFVTDFIKSFGIILSFIIGCKILLRLNLKRCIIISFLCEMFVIICEAIFAMLLALIFKFDLESKSILIAYILDNSIGIFLLFISNFSFIHRIYVFIDEITSQIKIYQIMLFLAFIMLISSSLFAYVYLEKNIPLVLIINASICIVYTVIVILVFNYQNRYYKANLKYQSSIDNLQAQELIIDEYRIMNHENKNQLLTIKSMTGDKKISNYINSLLKQKEKFRSEIIDASLQLPEGGIRGLIYTKLISMKEKGIKCNLLVDKNVTIKTFVSIDDNDVVDICQILGVFIDNAMEEVLHFDEKIVNINLNIEQENLIVKISNYYQNKLHFNKSGDELNTTKGSEHGYGLKLVKKLLSNNRKLKNETIITKNTFSQVLYIKIT